MDPPTKSERIAYNNVCLEVSQEASKALSRLGTSGVSTLLKASLSMFNLKDLNLGSILGIVVSLIRKSGNHTDNQVENSKLKPLYFDLSDVFPLASDSGLDLESCEIETPTTLRRFEGDAHFGDYRLAFQYRTFCDDEIHQAMTLNLFHIDLVNYMKRLERLINASNFMKKFSVRQRQSSGNMTFDGHCVAHTLHLAITRLQSNYTCNV